MAIEDIYIKPHSIELLAPAANLDAGMAAVDHGADALYVGGPAFGARRAAANSVEDIARLADYARPFGVRVYAALNTLIFEDELRQAESVAREVISAGVDALIIQDMAFLRMGLPPVELHASTQTFNTTPEKVRFLQESGFSRVILERGLSLGQIKRIRAATTVDLECFVHGAICVGYSGRCFLSRSMGPRSGNRGECSQPCRLTYDLADERGNVLLAGKHLLSVRDLDLSGRIGELLDAGVGSFKIEGRLKDVSYVKNTVAHFRAEIDRALAAREGFARTSSGHSRPGFTPSPAKTFTRGSTAWMLDGRKAGQASFDTPKALGEHIGAVTEVGKGCFAMKNSEKLNPGDGVCFMTPDGLSGTNVNRVEGGRVFVNKTAGITPGVEIYRNYDHDFIKTLEAAVTRRTIATRAEVLVGGDGGVTLSLTDEDGFTASEKLEGGFEPARDPEKMATTISSQISKSGDTAFDIGTVGIMTANSTGGAAADRTETGRVTKAAENPDTTAALGEEKAGIPFIPISQLNELRRRTTDALLRKRIEKRVCEPMPAENMSFPYPSVELGGEGNVTNSLAGRFYRDHGVERIAPAWELAERFEELAVMVTPYCIRRETGLCSKKNAKKAGEYKNISSGAGKNKDSAVACGEEKNTTPVMSGTATPAGKTTPDAEPLYLWRGTFSYRLEFDCGRCEMRIIKDPGRGGEPAIVAKL